MSTRAPLESAISRQVRRTVDDNDLPANVGLPETIETPVNETADCKFFIERRNGDGQFRIINIVARHHQQEFRVAFDAFSPPGSSYWSHRLGRSFRVEILT